MSHLDAERIVLLALGEPATDVEQSHLAACTHCREELAALSTVAVIGRDTQRATNLAMPPSRVWDHIAAATIDPHRAKGGPRAPAPRRPAPPARRVTLPPAGSPSRRTVAVALAAAAFGILATLGITQALRGLNGPTVTAQTTLAAYGNTPAAAHGTAELITQDGRPALQIHVADLPSGPGYYEVWLIDPTTQQMIAVGVMGGQSDVMLPLPSTVDVATYGLVDVSAELYDGNSAHSGHSLLRGTLTH